MSPMDPSKKLGTLLKKLRAKSGQERPARVSVEGADPTRAIVDELVFSMLVWEASTTQARAAYKRLHEMFVDYNDLRAAIDDEIAHVIGEKYPLGADRARRLRAALNDIYRRQHGVTLVHLTELSKRDARAYLESIEGVPIFASHRVLLGELGVHAIPVDERLRDLLAEEGVVDQASDVGGATSFLERNIHADESLATAAALQEWSDEHGQPPKKERKPAPAPEAPAKPAARKPEAKAKAETTRKTKARPKAGG